MEQTVKIEKNWPNLIKYICLFFIFLDHSEVYSNFHIPYYSTFVTPFYVNAFFFISGYFLIGSIIKQLNIDNSFQSAKTICKKNCLNILFKLLIPALIFSIIEYIPGCLIRKNSITIKDLLYKTIGGGTYWFVSALIVAELLIIALTLFRKKSSLFYFAFTVLFCVGGFYLCKYDVKIFESYPSFPYCYKQGLIASVFLALGGIFYQFEKNFDNLFRWFVILALGLTYFAILLLIPEYVFVVVSDGKINLLGIVVSLVSIIILIYLFKPLTSSAAIIKFFSFEGRHSIGLYFMSGAAPATFSALLSRFFPEKTIILLAAVFVLSFISANLINYALNKYAMFIFDFRKIKNKRIRKLFL